jgi:superoxide dismutase, Fe-Mn family
MPREPKNYDHLIGKIKGLSENQLKAHFTLYQGYVKKLNEIEQKLGTVDKSAPNYSYNEYSELKRREPVAYNGTFLHEYYFDNIGGDGGAAPENFKQTVTSAFGSYDNWIADVKAAAGSAHGWVLTCYGYADQKVRNVLVHSEHHVGLLADTQIIIAIDCWEHAYFMDYGTKKPDYIAAILAALNWKKIGERFHHTPPPQAK